MNSRGREVGSKAHGGIPWRARRSCRNETSDVCALVPKKKRRQGSCSKHNPPHVLAVTAAAVRHTPEVVVQRR